MMPLMDNCVKITEDGTTWRKTPDNGFYAVNNVWGKGNFVDHKDYVSRIEIWPDTFPVGTTFSWIWPNAAGPDWTYGYPEMVFDLSHVGQVKQLKDIEVLTVSYDVSITGNLNSFDILLDLMPTKLGAAMWSSEISFYPYWSAPVRNKGVVHRFTKSNPPFTAQVFVQSSGSGPEIPEIIIRPIQDNPSPFYDQILGFFAKYGWFTKEPRQILKGEIDLVEIFQFLGEQGLLDMTLYLPLVQLGAEPQCPNEYNTPPHNGSFTIKKMVVDYF